MTDKIMQPWEKVTDQNYFRSVLENMGSPKSGSLVRFGRQGEGIAPNYQIKFIESEEVTYLGISHSLNLKQKYYEDDHLSELFTYEEVQQLLANIWNKKKY